MKETENNFMPKAHNENYILKYFFKGDDVPNEIIHISNREDNKAIHVFDMDVRVEIHYDRIDIYPLRERREGEALIRLCHCHLPNNPLQKRIRAYSYPKSDYEKINYICQKNKISINFYDIYFDYLNVEKTT